MKHIAGVTLTALIVTATLAQDALPTDTGVYYVSSGKYTLMKRACNSGMKSMGMSFGLRDKFIYPKPTGQVQIDDHRPTFAFSLRVDHKINDKLNLFGRYNYSPSVLTVRGSSGALSTVSPTTTNTQTATVGALWTMSPVIANDFRFNYSRTDASLSYRLDDFGGAVPLQTLPLPFT